MNDFAEIRSIQQDYLPMMDDLHTFCINNDIAYSLSGGTLLGAVRHKGFIPWDDDVDIMFDRENYEKFMAAFAEEAMGGYELVGKTWVKRLSRKDNPGIDKEIGCIDLFVFDDVPDNPIAAKLKVLCLKCLQGMMKDKPDYSRFSYKYKVLLFGTWLLGRLFPANTKVKMYTRISQWGKRNDRSKAAQKTNIYNTWFDQIGRLKFDREIIDGYMYLDFEGRKYMAIQGYSKYLTELYGDYMKLPPEEKRIPSHKIL